MPELPDLEAIKNILQQKLAGVRIETVEILQPVIIRQPELSQFVALLTSNTLLDIERRGKFLLLHFESGHIMAIHLMLVGRLQYCEPSERRKVRTCMVFHMDGRKELRYIDSKLMGRVYLVEKERLASIPRWNEMGPDALDAEVTLEVFRKRLHKYSGQMKNILVKDTFLTGIGNAYADEILFEAGIYPFRPRASLSDPEVEALYQAMRSILTEAIRIVSERMGENTSEEIRDFLTIHRQGGKACPRCGSTISQVGADRRVTNFCRSCQKWENQASLI